MATLRVRLFAAHREAAGAPHVDLRLALPAPVSQVRAALNSQWPALARAGDATLFAVNGQFAPEGRLVREGDEVAAFPPVAGG